MHNVLPVLALATSCVTIGGVLVGAGMLIQRLRDLEARHRDNTMEHRTGHTDHEMRLRALEVGHARSSTQIEAARGRAP